MATRRTKPDRDAQYSLAESRIWTDFAEKLSALTTFEEAKRLVASAPPPDAPGRRFYSNLGFFLQGFSVPDGSGTAERSFYLSFIRKLDEAGELKPGARAVIEAAFKTAKPPRS